MSLGLILAKGFCDGNPKAALLLKTSPWTPRPTFFEIGNPSTTYRGSFPAVIDPTPLTLMLEPAPGSPELSVTWTPASCPWIAFSKLARGKFSIDSAEIEATEPVMSLFTCRP